MYHARNVPDVVDASRHVHVQCEAVLTDVVRQTDERIQPGDDGRTVSPELQKKNGVK